MIDIPDFDDRLWDGPQDSPCRHGRDGYCFDRVRERHNQDILDGKFDDIDADYASTPHPSAHYGREE